MADITIVNGVYKPTYNWGAPPCSDEMDHSRTHSLRKTYAPVVAGAVCEGCPLSFRLPEGRCYVKTTFLETHIFANLQLKPLAHEIEQGILF